MNKREINICNDCMRGHHEIIGHNDCDCICHMNAQCKFCGFVLIDANEIKIGLHKDCEPEFNESQLPEYHVSDEPFGRYEWEQ